MQKKIQEVQKHLREQKIDGWLLYDFHHLNALAWDFLQIPPEAHLTRRFFYWIPAQGEPLQIVHVIEPGALSHLPGEKLLYLKWQTWQAHLAKLLKSSSCIAMEYSPNSAIPTVSKVDAGLVDLIRSFGVKVVSSSSFLQHFTCVWDQKQLETHLEAARVLDETAAGAWKWVAEAIEKQKTITEYDLQQWILSEIHSRGCLMDGMPICCVGENSANPHYSPEKESAKRIQKGDFLLIDLWCKKKEPRAVYADITRVAVVAEQPTARQKEIFQIVRLAQKRATEFVQERWKRGERILGCEVDTVCRELIEKAGYGDFFTHRTGHNIHLETHGPGANIDSLETLDDRSLIAGTCFSVEPGIYLPGEFGVRLEYDIFLHPSGTAQVTGGIQEALYCIL